MEFGENKFGGLEIKWKICVVLICIELKKEKKKQLWNSLKVGNEKFKMMQ